MSDSADVMAVVQRNNCRPGLFRALNAHHHRVMGDGLAKTVAAIQNERATRISDEVRRMVKRSTHWLLTR